MTDKTAIEKLSQAILVLLIIAVSAIVIYSTFSPAANAINKFVSELLGIKATQATAPKDIATAEDSVNALLYSINKVAWYDTYFGPGKSPADADAQKIKDMGKDFVDAKAIPIYSQREKISVGAASKEKVMELMTRKMIDCKKIFNDRGSINTGCFSLDFSGASTAITQKELLEYMDAYYKDPARCDKTCKDVLWDLLGKGWGDWFNPFGLVNPYNINIQLTTGDSITADTKTVNLCAESPQGLLGVGAMQLYFTDDDELSSRICKLPDAEADFGMKVVNFNLPQEINTYSDYGVGGAIVNFAEKYVKTYGDPKYVVYYEVFPKGEETYWAPSAFTVDVAQVLTVQGIFFAIDVGLPFVGKGIGKILEPIADKVIAAPMKKLAATAAGRSVTEGINVIMDMIRGLRDAGASIFDRIGLSAFTRGIKEKAIERVAARVMTEDAIERSAGNVLKETVAALPKGVQTEELTATLKEETKVFFTLYKEQSGDGLKSILKADGTFTDEFAGEMKDQMKKTISDKVKAQTGKDIDENVLNNVVDKTMKDMSENTLKEAANPLKRLVRAASDVTDKIQSKLGFGVTDDEARAFLRDSAGSMDFIDEMSPSEVRRLTSDANKIVDMALEMQELNPGFVRETLGDSYDKDLAETLIKTKPELASQIFGGPVTDTPESIDAVSKLIKDYNDLDYMDLGKQVYGADYDKVISGKLDAHFDDTLKDVDLTGYMAGKSQTVLENFGSKKRNWITAFLVYSNLLDESMKEKFIPVGTNAIGVRSPFDATIVYDDTYFQAWNYNTDKNPYVDFFTNYAGYNDKGVKDASTKYAKYNGLLPEVNRYYLSLVKDKDSIFRQDNQRFHLVSPCKADLIVTKTICECWGSTRDSNVGKTGLPDLVAPIFEHDGVYSTGQYNSYYDKTIDSFDQGSQMLYTVGENGVLIKECYPKGVQSLEDLGDIKEYFMSESIYKPSCIEINPVMSDNETNNYCYHGQDPGMKVADYGLNYGVPIAASLICIPTGAVGAAACGAVGGAAGTLLYEFMLTGHQWPNHR